MVFFTEENNVGRTITGTTTTATFAGFVVLSNYSGKVVGNLQV